MADLGERVTRELTIRYIAVLAVLGFLALMSFVALGLVILEARGSGERINLAGRQRMLVEKAAFLANRLSALGRERTPELGAQLGETLDLLERRHRQLAEASSPPNPPEVEDIFFAPQWQLDGDIAAFVDRGRALLRRGGVLPAMDGDLVELSRLAGGPLMDKLDELTARYQIRSDQAGHRLVVLQGVSLTLALLVLVMSAFGVFRPLVLRLQSQMEQSARTARTLRESEERLWRILDESPIGVSVSGRRDGRVTFVNQRFADIIGINKDRLIGSRARDHYVDDAQRQDVLAKLRRDGRLEDTEVEFRRQNGEPFWSLLTIRSAEFGEEAVNLAWIYDITERKADEQQIQLAAKVLDTLTEGVVISDASNKIIFVNPAFSFMTEYSREEVIGQNPKFLSSGRHDGEFYSGMWEQLNRHGRWSGEVWNRRKSGEFYAEWLSISLLRSAAGKISHYVAVFSDITHRKEDEERIWRQANYDPLTGLPNRSLFMDRLNQAVRQARREARGFALMFLDLDGFKAVNDQLGHAAGDVLLQQTATRLSDCMRASDTLARLAGDEFVVILQGVSGQVEPAIVAGKILGALSRPYELEGGNAQIHGSIGIALFPADSEDGAGLIKAADEAMYAVKREGKNGFRFSAEMPGKDASGA